MKSFPSDLTSSLMAHRLGKESRVVLQPVYEFPLRLKQVDFGKQPNNYKQCYYERLGNKLSNTVACSPNQ